MNKVKKYETLFLKILSFLMEALGAAETRWAVGSPSGP